MKWFQCDVSKYYKTYAPILNEIIFPGVLQEGGCSYSEIKACVNYVSIQGQAAGTHKKPIM